MPAHNAYVIHADCRQSIQLLSTNACAGAHKDVVRGVRWLGATARIVSFSSERLPNSTSFRNTLLLSDARSRASMPFRCAEPPLDADSSPAQSWGDCRMQGQADAVSCIKNQNNL